MFCIDLEEEKEKPIEMKILYTPHILIGIVENFVKKFQYN